MEKTFNAMVIVLTALLLFYDFMVSDDFNAVKSSHILEAHPKNF